MKEKQSIIKFLILAVILAVALTAGFATGAMKTAALTADWTLSLRAILRLAAMAAGVLLALVSFGGERHFLRLTMLTFAIACALAGTVLGLGLLAGQSIPHARGVFYTNVNGKTLLISASGLYVLLAVLFRAAAAHGIRGERIPIRVSLIGRTVALMALRDTGHRLRDISGNPVLTVELRCFPQLAAEVSQLPAVEALPLLRRKYPELRPQLLPIHTVQAAACCSA